MEYVYRVSRYCINANSCDHFETKILTSKISRLQYFFKNLFRNGSQEFKKIAVTYLCRYTMYIYSQYVYV